MKDKIIAYIIVFAALFIVGIQSNEIRKLNNELDIECKNSVILLQKTIDSWRVDSTTNAAKIHQLNLTIEQYKAGKQEDLLEIKKLNLNIKQLKNITTTSVEASVPVHTVIRDTVVVGDTIKKISVNDKYIKIDGVIDNDSLNAQIKIPVTIKQYLHKTYKHKFLWFKWGTGSVLQTITTDNPYVEIKYSENIEIR